MSIYAEIDARILAAIAAGHNPIYERRVVQEAERIADATGRDDYRVTDGRLQALRKAKKIWYRTGVDHGWRIVQPADQPRSPALAWC